MRRLLFILIIFLIIFISCSNSVNTNHNSIDMDSDWSITQALIGTWITTDEKYQMVSNSDSTTAWTLNGFTYSGTYTVENRNMQCIDKSPSLNPVFKINNLTEGTLNITGIGRVAKKYGNLQLTRKDY